MLNDKVVAGQDAPWMGEGLDEDTVLDLNCQATALICDMGDQTSETSSDSDKAEVARWLISLAENDRETYRAVRELAWKLVAENADRSIERN